MSDRCPCVRVCLQAAAVGRLEAVLPDMMAALPEGNAIGDLLANQTGAIIDGLREALKF